jgi:hypothetical protein
MTWLPGWSSAENASTWSHIWFWFGMWCFLWLGIAEVIAFIYGLRKDNLVAASEQVAAAQAQQNQNALQNQLAEANRKTAELEQQQAPRRLSEAQKQTLITALSPYRGQKISLLTILGDAECKQFLQDFMDVLDAAGWDHNGGNGILYSMFQGNDPVGVAVLVSEQEAAAKRGPPGVMPLIENLAAFDIVPPKRIFSNPTVAVGEIKLVIGKKPITGFGYQ